MHTRAGAVIFLLCGFVVLACVASPRLSEIVPQSLGVATRLPYSVRIEIDSSVQLRPDTNFLGGSLTQQEFVEAASAALEEAGPFLTITEAGDSDFTLFVSLLLVQIREVLDDTPLETGFSMDSEAIAEWRLVDNRTTTTVLHESISGTGHVNFGDAFNGLTRYTIARERCLRDNLVRGLQRIQSLNLDDQGL